MGHEIARGKTSTRRGQPNPLFKETFVFQVSFIFDHVY
jgi:synaptotagmin-14/16